MPARRRQSSLGKQIVSFANQSVIASSRKSVRLRFAIEPSIGSLLFTDVHADATRYFMPIRPVTLAVRAEHVGRYGRDAGDTRLTPLIATLQSRVRGYALTNFAADECGRQATSCSLLDQIAGSRLALLNVELRAPVFGLPGAGASEPGSNDPGRGVQRNPASTNASASSGTEPFARVNIRGFVFEVTAARVFDRPNKAWTTSVLLRPGF